MMRITTGSHSGATVVARSSESVSGLRVNGGLPSIDVLCLFRAPNEAASLGSLQLNAATGESCEA